MKKKLIMAVAICVFLVAILFFVSPLIVYQWGKNQIYSDIDDIPHYEVAIVFGAGIKDDGTPSDALKDRLETAAELYDAGLVDTILVSGDNRFENYDEPTAMYEYLIGTEGIPAENIVLDYAGRRTYDTCVRAGEVFGVEEAILVTQGFHLPRAIFTCTALGIDSAGYSATNEEGYVFGKYYKIREIAAIYKAVFDIYIMEPDWVR
ncbi:MAG: hypothetical protein UV80_C0002G0201 [Candidatus Peregrinibacteria bacterium GW2011_GWF2_43_17]|nr:MAG: hypothetical protein UV80_C0002G0201 [Candidatus Peregrinibacteria bacterium GW2011_GWF2_43_17]KKT18770.1 MAG: hypothetical protein UW03_C0031G0002 [Candidatus Peregrinibacteria bacterium GW2011_GWA2_43_8]HAU39755.1 hypothetical protein [Candidatus Peregrinibacteria bacterium]